jgi:dCTP deaminase
LSKLHSKEAVAKSAAGRRAYYATDAGKLTSIESRRKMWITRGAEGRRKQAEVIRYLRFRDDITEQAVAMALLEAGTVRGAARLLKVDRSAFRRFPHIIELFKQGSLNNNHKVISISKLSDVEEDVYCLTAPETGNFALDAGVIAHNCGNFLNVTPIEPGWRGQITLEISNIGSDPVWIYPGEGIGQIIFMWIDGCPERTYADKQGKYQNQHGVTGPIVQMGVG